MIVDYPLNIVSRYGNFSEQLFSQDFGPRSFQFEEGKEFLLLITFKISNKSK